MTKATRGRYTLEFKQEAARLVESGQSMTAAARSLGVIAAVRAAIRHKHTGYDEMLVRGIDRITARQSVADHIEEILAAWRRSAPTV